MLSQQKKEELKKLFMCIPFGQWSKEKVVDLILSQFDTILAEKIEKIEKYQTNCEIYNKGFEEYEIFTDGFEKAKQGVITILKE